jgi:hypothetical protein
MTISVRLGQKLVKVAFRDGEPYFLYGTVSRVTKTTFDVTSSQGTEKSLTATGRFGCGWYKQNWIAAIDHQIEGCFRAKGIGFLFRAKGIGTNTHDLSNWPTEDLVGLVNRLWRFRKKCMKKLGRK